MALYNDRVFFFTQIFKHFYRKAVIGRFPRSDSCWLKICWHCSPRWVTPWSNQSFKLGATNPRPAGVMHSCVHFSTLFQGDCDRELHFSTFDAPGTTSSYWDFERNLFYSAVWASFDWLPNWHSFVFVFLSTQISDTSRKSLTDVCIHQMHIPWEDMVLFQAAWNKYWFHLLYVITDHISKQESDNICATALLHFKCISYAGPASIRLYSGKLSWSWSSNLVLFHFLILSHLHGDTCNVCWLLLR